MKRTNLKWLTVGGLVAYLFLLMAHPLPIEDSNLGMQIINGGFNPSEIQYTPTRISLSTAPSLLEKIGFQISRFLGLIGYHLLSILLVLLSFLMMIGLAFKHTSNLIIIGLISVCCIPLIPMPEAIIGSIFLVFLLTTLCFVAHFYWIEGQLTRGLLLLTLMLILLVISIPPNALGLIYDRLFYSNAGLHFTAATTILDQTVSLIGWALTLILLLGFYLNRKAFSSRIYLFWMVVTVGSILYSLFSLSVNVLALITIPVMSYHISAWWHANPTTERLFGARSPVLVLLVLLPLIWIVGAWNPFAAPLGLGAGHAARQPAHFFKQHDIAGPVFNNQLAASYLAYYLVPEEKIYYEYEGSNNASSYQSETKWQQVYARYQFGALFFRLKGESLDGLNFLGRRLADREEWALVYFEEGEWAILVRRNAKNKVIIDKFELIK